MSPEMSFSYTSAIWKLATNLFAAGSADFSPIFVAEEKGPWKLKEWSPELIRSWGATPTRRLTKRPRKRVNEGTCFRAIIVVVVVAATV